MRLCRAKRGMTRRQLAQGSGASERYLAQIEGGQGNPSVIMLKSIAEALDVPIIELLPRTNGRAAAMTHILDLLGRMPLSELPAVADLIEARADQAAVSDRARRIALVGLRGAGKSTLGQRLAAELGCPFIELDRLVEQEYGARIPDLIEMAGVATFRRYERACLERVIADHEAAVIATAGGIVANAETYALLLRRTHTVWIKARPDEHMSRVMEQGDFRPMAQNREAMADLVAILDARSADYARAEAELDTSGDTVERKLRETRADRAALCGRRTSMTLADQGFLDLGDMRLEYRMIGPRPDAAPTIVMLHEGLGCVGMWGKFPDKLAAATGAGVFVYSRAGYGNSSPSSCRAPSPSCTRRRATCCRACSTPSASGAASCSATATARRSRRSMPASIQDHRVRGLVLMAPHFFTEDMGIAEIARAKVAFEQGDSAHQARALARRCRQRVPRLERCLARSGFPPMGYHRRARLYPRADPDRAGRGRPVRHRAADRGGAARSATARSRSRCCRNAARAASRGAAGDAVARSPTSPTGCCATTTRAISQLRAAE